MILLLFAFIALAACQTTCSTGITNQVVGGVFSGSSTNTAAQTCNTFYSNVVLSATSSPALPSGFSSGAGSYSLQSSNFLGDSFNIRVGHVPASSTNGGSDPGASFVATATILTVSSSKSLNSNSFTAISVPAGRKPAISICCSNGISVCSNVAASSLNICWDTTRQHHRQPQFHLRRYRLRRMQCAQRHRLHLFRHPHRIVCSRRFLVRLRQ